MRSRKQPSWARGPRSRRGERAPGIRLGLVAAVGLAFVLSIGGCAPDVAPLATPAASLALADCPATDGVGWALEQGGLLLLTTEEGVAVFDATGAGGEVALPGFGVAVPWLVDDDRALIGAFGPTEDRLLESRPGGRAPLVRAALPVPRDTSAAGVALLEPLPPPRFEGVALVEAGDATYFVARRDSPFGAADDAPCEDESLAWCVGVMDFESLGPTSVAIAAATPAAGDRHPMCWTAADPAAPGSVAIRCGPCRASGRCDVDLALGGLRDPALIAMDDARLVFDADGLHAADLRTGEVRALAVDAIVPAEWIRLDRAWLTDDGQLGVAFTRAARDAFYVAELDLAEDPARLTRAWRITVDEGTTRQQYLVSEGGYGLAQTTPREGGGCTLALYR